MNFLKVFNSEVMVSLPLSAILLPSKIGEMIIRSKSLSGLIELLRADPNSAREASGIPS
jgi:hypothetical protein